MPAFWGYLPPPTHTRTTTTITTITTTTTTIITHTIDQLTLDPKSQVKTRQSQNYKLKEFAKTSNF